MSISFSGLASGLDTSSWVESLVALRQTKVDTLEEQKETVLLSRETLNNIKSFFNSFRSVLEKVTDAKFGIVSTDIFAQKLATSSNLNVLTGTATHEAEEATYNVLVDKLATNTEAISGIKKMTTTVQTMTALADTKLVDLGVKIGNIGIHNNGAYNVIKIEEKDTISDFVNKLHDIGVDASYNESTGIFGINLDGDDIDDTLTSNGDGTIGTGIVKAFHLAETGGYKSDNLEVSNVDTLVVVATGSNRLSQFGVQAGKVVMEANGAEYTFDITHDSTIEEFVEAMQSVNIDASFKDGVLRIIDAEITSEGGTNLVAALGLETKTNQNTQTSGNLSYTEIKTAGLQDKVTDFINGKGVVNIFDKNGTAMGSITITDSTTFESLFNRLSNYGINGVLDEGVISFSSADGNYMTGALMDALGVGITTTTTTYTSGTDFSSGGAVTYKTVTTGTTTIYHTTTNVTTNTDTIGLGMSSGSTVNYNTVTQSMTITYNTTTHTATSTSTSGLGMTSDSTINYNTVHSETVVDYNTLYSTTTVVTTIGTITTYSTIDVSGSIKLVNDVAHASVSGLQALSAVSVGSSKLSGTYAINTKADLIKLAELANSDKIDSNATFRMGADIDLVGVNWTPIGSTGHSFNATFDGNGYTIKNLTINSTAQNTYNDDLFRSSTKAYTSGLFGYLSGTVRNLSLESVNIQSGQQSIGAIAGWFGGTIDNCYVQGTITQLNSNRTLGLVATGALVGYSAGSIKNSHVKATVNGNQSAVGLIAGYGGGYLYGAGNPLSVQNSFAEGTIKGGSAAGGIVGYSGNANVESCVVNANLYDISGRTNSSAIAGCAAGGVIGLSEGDVTISNVKTSGEIKTAVGSGGAGIGGVIGAATLHNVTVEDVTSYATINVSYTTQYHYSNSLLKVGGLIGTLRSNGASNANHKAVVSNSIYSGAITVNATDACVGGAVGDIVAWGDTTSDVFISTFVSTAPIIVNVSSAASVGGVVGNVYGYRSGSYSPDYNDLIISSTSNRGNIIATNTNTEESEYHYNYLAVSGILGRIEDGIDRFELTNSSNSGTITASVASSNTEVYAGGAFGGCCQESYEEDDRYRLRNFRINHFSNTGGILADTGYKSYAGGVIGYSNARSCSIIMDNVSNNANIKSKYAGGLFGVISYEHDDGYDPYVSITNSKSSGTITGAYSAGGIASNCSALYVAKTYFNGVLSSGTTGGILAYSGSSGDHVITSCYASGTIPSGLFTGNSYSDNHYIKITDSYINPSSVPFVNPDPNVPTEATGANMQTVLGGKLIQVVLNYQYQTTTTSVVSTQTVPVIKTVPVTDTVAMTSDTKFSQIGMTGNNETIKGKYNGRDFTITMTSAKTLGNLCYELGKVGISASVKDGKLYISNSDNAFITSISNGLKSALKISKNPGVNSTWSVTTHTTITTTTTPVDTTVYTTTSVQMYGDTKFSQLGLSGNGTFTGFSNGKQFTLTVAGSDRVGDVIQTLNSYGFNASVQNGKFYVEGGDDIYLTGISNNLKSALHITTNPGNGTSYKVEKFTEETTVVTPSINTIYTTTTLQMTGGTKFSEIGMTSNQTIKGVHNGKNFTITVTGDDTVGDIADALSGYGINTSVRGGKLYINGQDGSYITELSSGIKSALNITVNPGNGTTYTTTTVKTYGNTSASKGNLKTITITAPVTRDAALSELGITTGEFNIWKDGVKYTALISSDETVGSFIDTLSAFGIQAAILKNGNSAILQVTGNGDTYLSKSASTTNASNIIDVLFPSANSSSTHDYSGLLQLSNTVTTKSAVTEDTLLSEFDTNWGDTMLKAAGKLALTVDGKNRIIEISENETFGSLIKKLDDIGIEASLIGGNFYISEMNNVSIIAAQTTSSIINPNATIRLAYNDHIDHFMESSAVIEKTTTTIEESTLSAANYADLDTQLKTLNISDGSLSIFRNGEKATIAINSENTFKDLRSQIALKFSDLDLAFEDGKLVIFSKKDGVEVKIGATTDTSNFLSITGISTDESGRAVSSRALYRVNENSLLTAKGLFRNGDVKQGNFIIGEAVLNIDDKTTVSDLISQINSSEKSNATAYWDSINGNFVLKSRTTGAALINIEAGTSNLTDIMGFTESEWYDDGSVDITRMNTDLQKLGDNARVTIDGTSYTAVSNTLTSDITRIKGLTINLTGLTNGSAVTLKVEKDKETVANALSDVVNAYNELMKNVDEAVAKDGALKKQTTLKMSRNQIRNLMTSSIGGSNTYKNLDAIGISVAKAAANNISTSNESIIDLSFDKDKFLKAYDADSDAVKELLIGQGIMGAVDSTDGVFTKIESIVENSLAAVIGYFSITDEAYNREIKKIDNKIVKGNEAIEKYRARLNKKFQSMDMLISNMQNQYSSFLGT